MPVSHGRLALTYDATTADAVQVQRGLFPVSHDTALDFNPPVSAGESLQWQSVIVDTRSDERPSIAVLLDQHLQVYRLEASRRVTEVPDQLPLWQREILEDLASVARVIDGDHAIPAEYAFLAALSEQGVKAFMEEAHALLCDVSLTRRRWTRFMRDQAQAAQAATAHDALLPLDDETANVQEPLDHGSRDLLSFADLRVLVHRGAMRGRLGLFDSSAA